MSSQDLIKFLTKEFVQYVDTPKNKRKLQKQERKDQRLNWSQHWFGLLPFATGMVVKPVMQVIIYVLRLGFFWKKNNKHTQ